MKIRLSYDESMQHTIADEGGCPVEVPDEQAERWCQASENWAKTQAEMKEAVKKSVEERSAA